MNDADWGLVTLGGAMAFLVFGIIYLAEALVYGS